MTATIGETIVLDANDMTAALKMANERISWADKHGADTHVYTGLNRLANDFEAAAGEIAFCKLFDTTPDYLNSYDGTDNGDCELDGFRIDVKTANNTRCLSPRLLCAASKQIKNKSDFFALMWGLWPKYQFRGFIRASDLFNPSRIVELGYGPSYAAEHWELKEFYAVRQ
jgi:hypothetical protein